MIDRNLRNLRRLRHYPDPFEDEDASSEHEGYVKWFGLWVREPTLFAVGFGLAGLMLALVIVRTALASFTTWLPTGALWFNIAFLASIVTLTFVACSMFVCGSIAVRRQIRHMNAQMARWDDATPEEVEEIVRAADRRINRRILWRTVCWMIAMAALFAIFGTTWLFAWGGPPAFIASTLVVVAVILAWSSRAYRIVPLVNRWMRRSS